MDKIQIANNRVDYSALLDSVNQWLQQHGAWKDAAHSRVGSTLTELLAALTAFNSAGVGVAQRENFLATARRPSSIYAATDFLGVRISRKSPARVQVTLTRTDSASALQIPPYTSFAIQGKAFFNRHPIVFAAGQSSLTITDQIFLYEGQVNTIKDVQLDDLPGFRKLRLSVPDFMVSDADVEVTVNGQLWTRSDEPLWTHASTDTVFNDRTGADGDAHVIFGNGEHGKYVANTDKVVIRYVLTSGLDAEIPNPPSQVTCSIPQVKGVTVSPAHGAANQKSPEYYRFMAPYIHRTQQRAVTPVEHVAIALQYPGIADVLVQAQRHVNPADIRWMNVCRLILLPEQGNALTAAEKREFDTWFKKRSWASLELDLTIDPLPVPMDIVVTLFCHSYADMNTVKQQVTEGIQSLFIKHRGIMGRTIAVSDVVKQCRVDGVDYVNVSEPTQDFIPLHPHQFATLGRLVVVTQFSTRR